MTFNAEKTKADLIRWLQDWFNDNGPGCNAVVGISGGKDSSVVAALCAQALGKDRVIGVLMPCGVQSDIDVAQCLVAHLGIRNLTMNIKASVDGILSELKANGVDPSVQTMTNLPARIRMATLYAVSQSNKGRVANTCNLSEDYVGYATRYGDAAGDFSPLSMLTVQEVKALGVSLGLPMEFVEKVPIDGLSGKTDEDNLGFTYAVLDRYIRTGLCDDTATQAKIDTLHRNSRFKLELMPYFPYE